jgi:hypothetical protein
MPCVGGSLSMLHATCTLAPPRTSLGERPRGGHEPSWGSIEEENDGDICGSRTKTKRKIAVKRVLVAGGSTSRASQSLPPGPQANNDNTSKAAECGAGELAGPIVHEVCHRFLSGPVSGRRQALLQEQRCLGLRGASREKNGTIWMAW